MDLYDNMLDSIQQFPLDANCFERCIRRLNRAYARHMARYQKILERMPEPGHRPLAAVQRHLEQCLRQKRRAIKGFMQCIRSQLGNLEEYNRMNGGALRLRRLAPAETSVLQTSDNALLEAKVCTCGSTDGGLLICCDSPACLARWYHARCAGVVDVPQGGWLCEKCRELE